MSGTYTVKQVAEILGYSTNSIYTFLKEKRIKGVRVGRGRFRIPQSELDRLLMINKKSSVITMPQLNPSLLQPVGFPVAPTGVVEPVHEGLVNTVYPTVLPVARVEVPSLFDWFVGISSIVLGFTMFLFSRSHEEYAIDAFLVFLPAIRVTLIAGGFGLLFADIVGKKFSIWHRIFHSALIISYCAYAFILSQVGDIEGIIIFGMLAGVLSVTLFVALGGIAGFALYVGLTLALLPVVGALTPATSSFVILTSFLPVPSILVVIFWWLIIALFVGIIWFGYQWDRRVFWIGMLGVSCMLIMLSVHFAEELLWGRALFILITGLLSLFIPVWQSLTFTHKRDRSFVFTTFGTLLVFYIIVVGILRIMQTNIIDFATRELENNVSYGKTLLESTILSTKTILSSSATNTLLVNALEAKDTKTLVDLSKAMFENTTSFHWVSVAAGSGESLVTYPYSSADSENFKSRDYFLQAITSQRVVLSDFYESSTDNVRKKSVIIVAPVMDSKQDVIGALLGSVDVMGLGNKLQQITASKYGEYFVIVDSTGKRVIHPDYAMVGLEVPLDDLVRLGATGQRGTGEGYSSDGVLTLDAYDTVDDGLHWGIAAKVPISNVLKETNAAGLMVFGVIIVSILMIAVFLLSHKARTTIAQSYVTDEKQAPARKRLSRVGRRDTS